MAITIATGPLSASPSAPTAAHEPHAPATAAPLTPATTAPAMAAPVAPASGLTQVIPPQVECVEDTGLEASFVADLILKIIYYHGVIAAGKIADVLCLPFTGVVDELVEGLKASHTIEVQGTSGPLLVSYKYALTDKGRHKV